MTDPWSCWASVPLALMREFVYEYGTVSPQDGALNFMTAEKMNTDVPFSGHGRKAHPDEFLVIITNGDSSHKASVN